MFTGILNHLEIKGGRNNSSIRKSTVLQIYVGDTPGVHQMVSSLTEKNKPRSTGKGAAGFNKMAKEILGSRAEDDEGSHLGV